MRLPSAALAALCAGLCACPSPHPHPRPDAGVDAGPDAGGFDAGSLPVAVCPADPGDGGCPAGMPVCGSQSDELCACARDADGGPGSCPAGKSCMAVPNYRDPELGFYTLDVCADVCSATCDPGTACSNTTTGVCACTRTSTNDTCSVNALLAHCGSDGRCGGLLARCDTAGAAGLCQDGLTCDGPFQTNQGPVNYCLLHCTDSSLCEPWMSCQGTGQGTTEACLVTSCGPGGTGQPANGTLFGDCSSTGAGGTMDGTCVPFARPPNTCVKDGLAPWFSPCYPTSLYRFGHAGRDDPGALCAHGSICVPFESAATQQRTGLALCLPLCNLGGGSPKCPPATRCTPMESDPNALEGVCVH